MWQTLNEILGSPSRTHCKKLSLKVGNDILEYETHIANAFNNYYSEIGSKLNQNFNENNFEYRSYMHEPYSDPFKFPIATTEEISNMVSRLNNTGPGHDGIPMFTFK